MLRISYNYQKFCVNNWEGLILVSVLLSSIMYCVTNVSILS